MPLSVLTGRADVMQLLDKDVFFFTTFGGEALSLAAAKATIEVLQREDVPRAPRAPGQRDQAGYNELAAALGLDFTRCIGLGCRIPGHLRGQGPAAGQDPLVMKSLVQQELIRHGVLWTGFHNLSYAHSDADVDHLLAAYQRGACRCCADALDQRQAWRRRCGASRSSRSSARSPGFHTKPNRPPRSTQPRWARPPRSGPGR